MRVPLSYLFAAQPNVTDSVLEVVAYEARRLFRDRLVSLKDVHAFDNILSSIVRGDWGSDALDNMTGGPGGSILAGRHLRHAHACSQSFYSGGEGGGADLFLKLQAKRVKRFALPELNAARRSAVAAAGTPAVPLAIFLPLN